MQFTRLGEIAFALGVLQFGAGTLELFFQVAGHVEAVAFGLPFCSHGGGLLLQVRQFLFQLFQTVAGSGVVFFLPRLGFDLELQDLAIKLIQFFGFAVDLHPQAAGGLVHKVDRLVGKEAVGDVAVRQGGRRDKGRVADADAVVEFVFFLDAAQDGDGVFDRGFGDHHRLEAAGEGCVLFHVFAVFIQRGGTDAVQLAPREGGFDQVGGIHRAIGFARADQRVHFIDEEDDFALGGGDLVQDGFEAFFEFAAIFGPGDQGPHVERHEFLVAQGFGHVAVDDAQGEALGDGGFADAGFADQHRVVLGAA